MDLNTIYPAAGRASAAPARSAPEAASVTASGSYNVGASGNLAASGAGVIWVGVGMALVLFILTAKAG